MEKVKPSFSRLILVGGSAGALTALLRLFAQLKADFPHPLVIVLHRKGSSEQGLADLLAIKTNTAIREVEDKDELTGSTFFLVPSDYHLLFERDGTLSLDDSEKVAYSRPSIDVAFQSAADAYGDAVVGVLLSGANADGTDGLIRIRRQGGVSIAQDPAEAEFPYMPQSAIDAGAAEEVFDINAAGRYLNSL